MGIIDQLATNMTDNDAFEAQFHYNQLLISNLKLQLCCTIILEKIRGKKRLRMPGSCFTYSLMVCTTWTLAHEHYRKDPLHGLQPRRQRTRPGHVKAVRDCLTNSYSRPGNMMPWQEPIN
ncbi:hypothetical protein Pcinc_012538 [Petrolisthes cinctipes]|uniref:Uncharacterized protein n=1 Tax=Petrolisthes cinctipes TaxID=88211 RepID=A0AAE1FZ40_PETCI|nr:hypothetical protein Pcinc_012538 [Petrolisthes cinctipes]